MSEFWLERSRQDGTAPNRNGDDLRRRQPLTDESRGCEAMTPIDEPRSPWYPSHACLDCGYLYDWYMVTNEVWEAAGLPPDALCCLACLEHRLDRPLTITDFTPCLINRLAFAAAGKLHVIM